MDTWTWGTWGIVTVFAIIPSQAVQTAGHTSGFRCDKPESLFVTEEH